MTSLSGGNSAEKDLKKLMQQIIDERDAKYAPNQEGVVGAASGDGLGGMFDKPEVKSEEGDAIIDLLGYLEKKRSEVLDSYQSKVMRRSSKPLPKPKDVDVSNFLSEAGLSPTSAADPMTIMSSEAPKLSKSKFSQMSDNFFMEASKEPEKPMSSSALAARESLPLRTSTGLMSPDQSGNTSQLKFNPLPTIEDILLKDSVDRNRVIQKVIGVDVDGTFGNKSKTQLFKWQKDNNLEPTGLIDQSTIEKILNNPPSIEPALTSRQLTTGLTISEGTRHNWSPNADMYNISLDYNSSQGGTGTEVIIPNNASTEVRDAANNFNALVVEFARSKGYDGYKNRGVKTRSENKRGVPNTIHVEPFFRQDSKMEKLIKDNMDEFSLLYTEAFGNLPARMISPHGKFNSKGIQDKGATSEVFGTELAFGNMIISSLLGKNK